MTFGTPHRGSKLASWVDTAQSVVARLAELMDWVLELPHRDARPNYVNLLTKNALSLEMLHLLFHASYKGELPITSLFETEELKGVIVSIHPSFAKRQRVDKPYRLLRRNPLFYEMVTLSVVLQCLIITVEWPSVVTPGVAWVN